MLVLRPEEPGEERVVRELVLLRVRELLADDRGDLREMQAAEQLIDLVGHWSSWSASRKYSLAITRRMRRSSRSRSKRPYCSARVTAW